MTIEMTIEKPKRKTTVTIGIPAYNEEANIEKLLKTILKQEQKSFVIEKIYVFTDGCTDNTSVIVSLVAKESPAVVLADDRKRKGKTARLNQLHQINESDIVINFDADIVLSDKNVVEKLIRHFEDKDVVLVSGNNQPLAGKVFFEKITNASDLLWYEIRKDFNSGDNIYNSAGCATVLRKDYAKKLIFPGDVVADQQYIYLAVKKEGKKYIFDRDAIVYYRTPNNLKDFLKQAGRSLIEKKYLEKYFDESYKQFYLIPASFKLRGIFHSMRKNGFFTILAILLQMYLRLASKPEDNLHSKGMWDMVESTKKIR